MVTLRILQHKGDPLPSTILKVDILALGLVANLNFSHLLSIYHFKKLLQFSLLKL